MKLLAQVFMWMWILQAFLVKCQSDLIHDLTAIQSSCVWSWMFALQASVGWLHGGKLQKNSVCLQSGCFSDQSLKCKALCLSMMLFFSMMSLYVSQINLWFCVTRSCFSFMSAAVWQSKFSRNCSWWITLFRMANVTGHHQYRTLSELSDAEALSCEKLCLSCWMGPTKKWLPKILGNLCYWVLLVVFKTCVVVWLVTFGNFLWYCATPRTDRGPLRLISKDCKCEEQSIKDLEAKFGKHIWAEQHELLN